MSTVPSNSDAILVAIPMLVFLVAAFFRLDELFCRPRVAPKPGRSLSGWDERGVPICPDPGAVGHRLLRRRY